jgi:hypothetical protein
MRGCRLNLPGGIVAITTEPDRRSDSSSRSRAPSRRSGDHHLRHDRLRYEGALAFEAAGQPRWARADFERIYAEAPDHEDVARCLGMTTLAGQPPVNGHVAGEWIG